MRKRTALCCCCAGTRSPSWHLCFQPKLIVAALTASYMKICAWTWHFSLIQTLAMSFLCFISRPPPPPWLKLSLVILTWQKWNVLTNILQKKCPQRDIKPKENILTVLFVFYIQKSQWRTRGQLATAANEDVSITGRENQPKTRDSHCKHMESATSGTCLCLLILCFLVSSVPFSIFKVFC